MYTIPPARPDLYHDLRTGEARIPWILTQNAPSAQDRHRDYARLADAALAPDPGPGAPDHVRAAHTAATRPMSLARLENGTPVSGDLITILRAFGGHPVIARTVAQVAEDLRDSVPDLIREGEIDVEALIVVGAAWLTGGHAPADESRRADATLSRHVFETPEEARFILEEAQDPAWKAPGA